ncbi:MAG: DNA adenine methylase [Nanoarchaeota archaeon]|nr:DNA adenine methylase [Nanoarchaeota archaeon]
MRLPHPIPYQGSKRGLANHILRCFPKDFDKLIEPFAGSGAVTIAAAYYFKAKAFHLNDINQPLISLWNEIINNPKEIVRKYHDIWFEQLGKEETHYYELRNQFNMDNKPEYLLFLLARCVKAAVRYNNNGGFNQSPDHRRKGRHPSMMREDILKTSQLLKGKTTLSYLDYKKVLKMASCNDLVYMDPPYQGTGQSRGFKYYEDIDQTEFITELSELNKRKLPYILSYDGRTSNKVFGKPLPKELELIRIEVNAGRSSQATLLKRRQYTYESIYLSPALIEKISPIILQQQTISAYQMQGAIKR